MLYSSYALSRDTLGSVKKPFYFTVGTKLSGTHAEEGKGGRPPSQFGLNLGGAPSLAPFPSFPLKPIKAHIPPGGGGS